MLFIYLFRTITNGTLFLVYVKAAIINIFS